MTEEARSPNEDPEATLRDLPPGPGQPDPPSGGVSPDPRGTSAKDVEGVNIQLSDVVLLSVSRVVFGAGAVTDGKPPTREQLAAAFYVQSRQILDTFDVDEAIAQYGVETGSMNPLAVIAIGAGLCLLTAIQLRLLLPKKPKAAEAPQAAEAPEGETT
jgi:hypothetical protein